MHALLFIGLEIVIGSDCGLQPEQKSDRDPEKIQIAIGTRLKSEKTFDQNLP